MENKSKVHKILAQSYLFYFVLFLVGVFFDFLFPIKIFQDPYWMMAGLLLIVLATLLIFWAQRTSRNLNIENVTLQTFLGGPYRYTRSPTHWGLSILMLGFGITINAFFIIITTIISFIITKAVFLRKEEKILAEKYGTPYLEYKKSVKL